MKPLSGAKISWSAKRFLKNFNDDHWLHHPMNVNKSNFNFYIYTLFLDHFSKIYCDDSVLIVQNKRRRKVIKQRVRP